ncbi:MAG: DNA primase [Candidatus Doudnabacteria bacterium]|nr:DNA primase [Candidatus Doudnabacteria bacterium]
MATFDSPIQEIKDRLPIAEVLADYVQMKKAGTNFKAACPFHNEKTPSLMISPSKQIWHCFGCGLGGDIFEFIKLAENVEFAEALKILADRAGIELKKPTQEQLQVAEKKHTLYDINATAVKYYSKVLWESRAGNEALLYLRGRGLTDQTIRNWQLGFSPDDFHYLEQFLAKSFPKPEIELAGLIIKRDNPRNSNDTHFDRFRGRVMFPIQNIHGQIVGFTGRILKDQKDAAKYVNTPETPIYNKSRELFGLYQAKNSIRKENRAILVEGNMDVIACHQAGFSQTVASSGTALTSLQLQTIQRFTENIIFAFDSDSAGAAATRRALEEALNLGFNVKIVDMKEAKDPDELIRKGIGIWKKTVDTAANFAEYFFDITLRKNDVTNVEVKRQVVKELAPLILRMSDPVTRGHFVRKLSKGVDVAEQAIWDIINKLSLPKPAKPQKGPEKRKNRREVLEDQLLGLCLVAKNNGPLKDFETDDFSENSRPIHRLLVERGFVSVMDLKKTDPELATKQELLLFAAQLEAEEQKLNPEQELLRVKADLKRIILKERMQHITDQLRVAERSKDKEQLVKLSEQFTKLSQEIQQYDKA